MKTVHVKFTDFRACAWRERITVLRNGREARLAPTFLLQNEMGVTSGVEERITADHWAKVTFDLPPGKPRGALLLWYLRNPGGGDNDMVFQVNGVRIKHVFRPEPLLTGGWDRHALPAKLLKSGVNEIVFSDCGLLRLDPGDGKESRCSFDAGKTWHQNAFGPARDTPGEYMVRLRVKGHPSDGTVTSPVIDLADARGEGNIAVSGRYRDLRLTARTRAPKGARIRFELRSGDSPQFDPICWTPWRETNRREECGRFVQWRATLETGLMEATPSLLSVEIEAKTPSTDKVMNACEIVAWERPELKRSSYDFTWLTPHPRVERLVKQWRLDELIAPAQNDRDRLMLLCDWCYKQWFGWQRERYPWCPSWDPIDILDTVKNNWGYGMCTHWGALYAGCAAALGFVSRIAILDHHLVAEVWLDDLDKWILVDPARGDGGAMFELDGKTLNHLEAHRALLAGRIGDVRARVWRPKWSPAPSPEGPVAQRFGQQEHLVPIGGEVLHECFRRLGIALRNNHLVQSHPAEYQHGEGPYHWNGYLWWSNEADPKYPEYSLHTQREADLYWTVGKVRIYLETGDEPGRLTARFEHVMPNFSHYEARIDGGEWRRIDEPYLWFLKSGDNSLEIRAVSTFGKVGQPTRVAVAMN